MSNNYGFGIYASGLLAKQHCLVLRRFTPRNDGSRITPITDPLQDLISANDLIISNPEQLTPEHFVTKLKDTLRRENIPIQELSILTTQENYPIYMGLQIVKQSFDRTEIPLSAGEYEQLKPFLPEDIDRYITYSDGRYILQFAPLSDDRMELLELIRQAQKKLAYMA